MNSIPSGLLRKDHASSTLEALIIDALFNTRPDLTDVFSHETAGSATLESLGLSSLETLQWAMEIETRCDIEIEAVSFAPKSTVVQLAGHLEALKQAQKKTGK